MSDDGYRKAFPPHRYDTSERPESMCSYTAVPRSGGLSVYCPFPADDPIHSAHPVPLQGNETAP